jgi:hypothetical protein
MTMQLFTAAAWLAGLLALAGLGGMALAARVSSRRLSAFDKGVLALLWGPLLLSVLALALADAGCFSLRLLTAAAGLWGLAGLILLLRPRPARPEPEQEPPRAAFLLSAAALLAATCFLITPAHTYLFGGWDPGEYVCTASNIARTGALEIHDPILASLKPAQQRTLMHEPEPPRRTLQPGYLVTDPGKGLLMPDYFHLYPSWLAVWVGLFGLGGAWAGHTAIALFALGMVVLAAGSLFGKRTALLAGAALALCPAQLYLMRFTTAEMMTQFCLFAGFWALERAWRRPGAEGVALTAGAAFGAAILAHSTSVLPVAGILMAAAARARVSPRPGAWGVLLATALFSTLAMAWNLARADVMTRFLWTHLTSHPSWWMPAAGLAAAAIAAGPILAKLLLRRQPGPAWNRAWRWTPLALALLLGALGYFVRPRLDAGPDGRNLVFFASLLGPAGALLAVAFFGLRRWTDWTDSQRAFLVAGLVTAGVLLAYKMVQPVYLWAARRWVPVVFPFAAILAAETAISLMRRMGNRGRARQAGGLVLVAALAAGWYSGMRPRPATLFRSREFEGLPAFMTRVASAVADADVVLCWHAEPSTPLRYLYNLPTFALTRLPEKTGIRNAKAATALILRWLKEGKRVYWIGEPFYHPSMRAIETTAVSGQFQILERRLDRLPRNLVREKRTFRICRLEPDSTRPFTAPITLDVGFSAMGLIRGFSMAKQDWEGAHRFGYRQTIGTGALYIPALAGTWSIRMKHDDPAAQTLPVKLLAEGRELAVEPVTRQWRDHRFTLPPGLGTNGVVLLEIARTGISIDRLSCAGD